MTDAERYGPSATWRGLTAIDPVTASASLSLVDEAGAIHRFCLPVASLAQLAGALVDTLGAQAVRTNVHSVSSSGSRASEGSSPFEGNTV